MYQKQKLPEPFCGMIKQPVEAAEEVMPPDNILVSAKERKAPSSEIPLLLFVLKVFKNKSL